MHIILIGFKHVGKSTIAKLLAQKLSLTLIDLDREVEKRYKNTSGCLAACRKIFGQIGERAFRALEHETLADILAGSPTKVISLGGGAPTNPKNQKILKGQTVVHITSPKEAVYERIMLSGKPAFLSPDENSYESFSRVWDERKKIYEELATIRVENNGKISETVEAVVKALQHTFI